MSNRVNNAVGAGRVVWNFVKNPPQMIIIAITGAVINIFSLTQALPFYGATLGILAWKFTAIFINKSIGERICKFDQKFFFIKIIAALAVFTLSFLNPIVGLIGGIILGIYLSPILQHKWHKIQNNV